MNWAAIIWTALLVFFLIVEAACPIHLVSVWFAVGALAATVVACLGGAGWLQLTLFVLISGTLLAALWPLVRKYLNPKHVATNVDSIVHSVGIVTDPIDNISATGQVKLGAMEWTARSTSGDPICAGTKVNVDRIEGVKVYVSPAEIPVNL